MRRIVQYPSSTQYSEVKISPQWHQWLRHTRKDAPSLTEQSQDLVRQAQLKILAKQADERWAAKPSFLDKPREASQALPAMQLKDPGGYVEKAGAETTSNLVAGVNDMPKSMEEDIEVKAHVPNEAQEQKQLGRGIASKKEKVQSKDPWKQNRGGPSETWQPKAWDGGAMSR
jgi:NADH dehydrogenase [ubiquinone] 1 alpha subcomplex assembly factor 2